MKKIISIIGHERAGKDTTAEFLKDILIKNNWSVYSFSNAGPLKQICCSLLNCTTEELELWKNEKRTVLWQGKLYYTRDFIIHVSENIIKPALGNDVWAKAIQSKELLKFDFVIKTDDRYLTEFAANPSNTLYIGISKPEITGESNTPYYDNICQQLDNISVYNPKNFIYNNGTLNELKEKVLDWYNLQNWN